MAAELWLALELLRAPSCCASGSLSSSQAAAADSAPLLLPRNSWRT